jgi:hypothetical protein
MAGVDHGWECYGYDSLDSDSQRFRDKEKADYRSQRKKKLGGMGGVSEGEL